MSKLLVFAAPSGAGKTTIVQHLLKQFESVAFSVSVTTRPRRPYEKEGIHYYFISAQRFKKLIKEEALIEWEEVYHNQFYGTLKSEVQRLWEEGKNIIFDIDVKGALNIKKYYPKESLAIFIKTPTPEILFQRLYNRNTESKESLKKRIDKAKEELTFENKFDKTLVNDNLEIALKEAEQIVDTFITQS